MSIRIVTDSGSDLQRPDPSRVTVLPLTITFGDESFRDGVDLDHRRFYERLIEGEHLPTTSQISPAAFEDAFRAAAEAGETVVAITLSSKLSGTYQSACIAAENFPGTVLVVDSENVTVGQQILVERALELVDQGLGAEELAARLEQEKKDIRLVALLDTLEYLKRGGRISPSIAMVGGLLSIKPVVAVQDGEVVLLGKARRPDLKKEYNISTLTGQQHLENWFRSTCRYEYDLQDLLIYCGKEMSTQKSERTRCDSVSGYSSQSSRRYATELERMCAIKHGTPSNNHNILVTLDEKLFNPLLVLIRGLSQTQADI